MNGEMDTPYRLTISWKYVIYTSLIAFSIWFLLGDGTSYSQQVIFVEYEDPDGNFNMEYPGDWIIHETKTQIRNQTNLYLTPSETSPLHGLFRIYIDKISENDTGLFTLRNYANRTLEYYKVAFGPDLKEVQTSNFSVYKVNNSDAVITGATYGTDDHLTKEIDIGSFVGQKFVGMMFVSSPDDYDSLLPIVNKIIANLIIH